MEASIREKLEACCNTANELGVAEEFLRAYQGYRIYLGIVESAERALDQVKKTHAFIRSEEC